MIQAGLDAYHATNGTWSTADGLPGDIVWENLAPGFLESMPAIDRECEWQINSAPEGKVCLLIPCRATECSQYPTEPSSIEES